MVTLASNQAAGRHIAVDSEGLYWSTNLMRHDGGCCGNALTRISLDGGSSAVLVEWPSDMDLADFSVAQDSIFFTQGDAPDGGSILRLGSTPIDGGPSLVLVSKLGAANNVVLDSTSVYLTAANNTNLLLRVQAR